MRYCILFAKQEQDTPTWVSRLPARGELPVVEILIITADIFREPRLGDGHYTWTIIIKSSLKNRPRVSHRASITQDYDITAAACLDVIDDSISRSHLPLKFKGTDETLQ
jgi:hypothetical protein